MTMSTGHVPESPLPDAALPFPEALRTAAEIAVLSPSSHNSQPWAIASLTSDRARAAAAELLAHQQEPQARYLALAIDRDRRLDTLPAHTLEMLLSCGLYWTILQRALAALGWSARRVAYVSDTPGSWLPDGIWPARWAAVCVAVFERRTPDRRALDDLRTAAQARRTNRLPYQDVPVEPGVLDALSRDFAGDEVSVCYLRTDADRARLSRFIARHAGRDFSHAQAWRETHSFIRWSPRDTHAYGDGFTPDSLFGPLPLHRRRLMRLALSPAAMTLLGHIGYHRYLAGQLARLVRSSPAAVVLTTAHSDPEAGAGLRCAESLANFWLAATQAGLALHPVSVVLQHDDLRAAFQAEFGLPGRAFFLARLGYPRAECQPAPRRPAMSAWREV